MILRNIYDKDITREINPAVVVSNKKEETIKAEILEYVFTNELIEKLYIVLNTVLNKKNVKAGIWINGYYGSGKSHFIKYVHYLLDNNTSKMAFSAFEKAVVDYDNMKPGGIEDITLSNIKLLKKRVIASNTDNIMFNVEDETDDGSQERMTRIFLNMFNKFRGYNANDIPLALLLEKPLDKKGVFEEFKNRIQSELQFNWDTDAATVAAFQLESVLEIAKSVYSELDALSLHAKLSNTESFKVGINATLIPELLSFLEDKDDNYRLLFLVDEVSQYIGSNKEILLNFQNIIERISNDCNNQVWVACTAQQTLDEVSSGTNGVQDVQDEFGKILGRFDTRISLQSNDASYITQRRVLDKNSVGIALLTKMFATNRDYIENQFKISHELFKGYQSEDEFIIGYPFVPYQFKLIAHVFEAFEVGGFIPFDAFYNNQFTTNLTHRGAKAVQNAFELSYVQKTPFAERVVKVLFMISNLLETQRQTFPSTIENMAVLLMNKLDQNKMQLQKDIKEVLSELIEDSIIREENGSYFFFNEDEMDVQNLIKSQRILLEDKYSAFDNIFRPLVNISPKVRFGQNDFKMNYSIENKEFFRNGDFKMTVLLTDNTHLELKAMEVNNNDLIICVNEWFNADDALRKEFDWYCKTNKYFNANSGGEIGERSKTNENFKVRNNQLKAKIEETIKYKFNETRFISQHIIIESNQIKGTSASDRIKNLIDKHLSGIYKNHKLSELYARNQAELKKSAASTQIMMPHLEAAEVFVNDFISVNNNQITVLDIIDKFKKEPFGWRFEAVLDVLLHLVKKKKREFVYKGQKRYPIVDFINKAVTMSERMSCEIVTGVEIDQAILDNVAKAFKFIFNENLSSSSDGNEQFDILQTALKVQLYKFKALKKEYYGAYPFGVYFQDLVEQLNTWVLMRDPQKLFNDIINCQSSIKELFDTTKGLEDFTQRSLREYKTIRSFVNENKDDFIELEKEERGKADKICAFFKLSDPRKEFRHVRKAYDEVNNALDAYKEALKEELRLENVRIQEELKKEATKRKVETEIYDDKEELERELEETKSITALKNKKLNAQNYKTKQLTKIIEASTTNKGTPAAEPVALNVTNGCSTISNEAEMDIYLVELRKEMMKLLNANKTIILK